MYSIKEEIVQLAKQCLYCNNAHCMQHCPLSNNIPLVNKAVAEGNEELAYSILAGTSVMGAFCGGVCPHSLQCQGHCVKWRTGGVKIGKIEQYIASECCYPIIDDQLLYKQSFAVVGAGPAGIAVAIELARHKGKVTIYEATGSFGGVCMYGIPSFRLDKQHVDNMLKLVKQYNIDIVYNVSVGRDITLDQLADKYCAVVVAVGYGKDYTLGIVGEQLAGVVSGSHYLANPTVGNTTIVVGGGNVAIDCARTAKRLGDNTTIAYRRTKVQMPAFATEIQHAVDEGINIVELVSPQRIVGDDRVQSVVFDNMMLSDIQADGRASVIKGEGTTTLQCSQLIVAIGSYFDSSVLQQTNIPHNNKGITVDDNGCCGGNIYACGDIVNNNNTVVYAVLTARNVARAIVDRYGK